MIFFLISFVQKVADEKGAKAKKGGAKGKKDDGPAQNGETKTNEVRGESFEKYNIDENRKCLHSATGQKIMIFVSSFCPFVFKPVYAP